MLFNPITLPNGAVLKNRLVKAAMEESLARPDRTPSDELIQLYRRWSEGGCALLLTGNVMVDGNHMTGAGNLADRLPRFCYRQLRPLSGQRPNRPAQGLAGLIPCEIVNL